MSDASHVDERLEVLTSAALTLARATPDDIDASIENVAGDIARFAGTDRVHVFLLDRNGTELSCTHEWCADGAPPFRDDMQYMPADLFPWAIRKLRASGTIVVERIDELPVAASGEKQILIGMEVGAAVAFPLIHGTLIGFVTFEVLGEERTWPQPILDVIATVTELITSAITRKDAWDGQEKLIGELRLALTEVSTLSGLLPICASCKSVRDDKGYWHRVEAYLHTHSDLEFTHGLCPQCAQKMLEDEPTSD